MISEATPLDDQHAGASVIAVVDSLSLACRQLRERDYHLGSHDGRASD